MTKPKLYGKIFMFFIRVRLIVAILKIKQLLYYSSPLEDISVEIKNMVTVNFYYKIHYKEI